MTIRVLNLYAGIGSNRKLWDEVADIEVTAVENNPEIAAQYEKFFPHDRMVIADAKEYMVDHFDDYDIVWASPPCQSHSRANNFLHAQGVRRLPDQSLWQIIIFLRRFCDYADNKIKWVVENVQPYYRNYTPLPPTFINSRHWFWANFPGPNTDYKKSKFNLLQIATETDRIRAEKTGKVLENMSPKSLSNWLGIDMDKKIYTGNNHDWRQVLRNCVHPEIGKKVFQAALGNIQVQGKLHDFF